MRVEVLIALMWAGFAFWSAIIAKDSVTHPWRFWMPMLFTNLWLLKLGAE